MVDNENLITLTADIVSAHVANNSVAVGDVGNLVQRVYEALSGLEAPAAEEPEQRKIPVVSVRASVRPDYIVCMECGRRQKTLKRHLQTAHGMTPAAYRQDYGLPASYPMVAPAYSAQRSAMAKSIGLGSKGRKAGASPKKPAPQGAARTGRGKARAKPAKEGSK